MIYDLILMDGTVIKTTVSGIGQSGNLWIHAVDIDFMECIAIFGDSAKTGKMTVQYSPGIKDEFVGYAELFSVSKGNGFVKIGLAKVGNTDANN